ncbi:MAG TPA: hypothetical protein VGO00_14340, partial [Kofleriaceae bacterium]|nr:hypothetical protein [Kofleriaceae bacterium]
MHTLTRCIAVTLIAACTSASEPTTFLDPSSPDAPELDGGTDDTVAAPALPLGTATVTQASVTCGHGAAAGAACMNLKVSCPGIPDVTVMLANSKPVGTSKGTIVAHDGGSGTAFYNGNTGDLSRGFAQSLTAKGFRFVQLAWTTDWASTGKGIKTAGCRPATLFRWIFDNIHDGSRTTSFCGMG